MPPENQSFVPVNQPTYRRVGKFTASYTIVKDSWALLLKDREMLWFPVMSFAASVVAAGIFALLYFAMGLTGGFNAFMEGTESLNSSGLVILFLYYVVMFFIINFFQAGIFVIAHARMNGVDLKVSDGISVAQKVAGKVFIWSVISATVGIILSIISERSKLVGRIVSSLLGAAWGFLTFFALPAMVIKNMSVTDSFKESTATIRRVWGETFIVTIGTGMFFGLIAPA